MQNVVSTDTDDLMLIKLLNYKLNRIEFRRLQCD